MKKQATCRVQGRALRYCGKLSRLAPSKRLVPDSCICQAIWYHRYWPALFTDKLAIMPDCLNLATCRSKTSVILYSTGYEYYTTLITVVGKNYLTSERFLYLRVLLSTECRLAVGKVNRDLQ